MRNSARRHVIWEALSELYLDTALTEADFKRLRAELTGIGVANAEVAWINDNEVAPVLLQNLVGVAGIWSGFDQAWLGQTIRRRRYRPEKRLFGSRRLWRWWVAQFVGNDLRRLLDYKEPTS